MGHALFVTLQDIFVRYRRMSGYDTLWLPGTDHAGIATQMVVERALAAQGRSRRDMTRADFVDCVWDWKHKTGGYITQQLRLLGASADWSREKFTLDADVAAAVVEAFIALHERGLVYRSDNYMVHWSPTLQTALSDLEVEYAEEQGWMHTFRYPLVPLPGEEEGAFIPISTTRPETLLGDAAVCVSPADPRYAHLVGRRCRVPFCGREIPVLADEGVDSAFGTGALKVTPAHDPVDHAIGERHGLPRITIMNKDGTINAVGAVGGDGAVSFEGLDRFVARERMWSELEAHGLAISRTPHTQRVPRSQRSGEVVESMVSPQWFVRVAGMAAKASHCVDSGQLTLLPARYEKTWRSWLAPDKIRDWCVSRQLWWGHRIPVYYLAGGDKSQYVVARCAAEAEEALRRLHGLPAGPLEVEQEEDVLDTWFR
jgi:valyl-tRNA synthetase